MIGGVINFDDYQSDMDELGSHGANIIKKQRREIDQLRRLLGEVIISAGGQVVVSESLMAQRDRSISITQYRNPGDRTHLFEAEFS